MPIARMISRRCKRCGSIMIEMQGDNLDLLEFHSSKYCYSCCRAIAAEKKKEKAEKDSKRGVGETMQENKQDTTIFSAMAEDVQNADIPEAAKEKLLKNIAKLRKQKINLMITGATGCGKSSTINALFDMSVAKVGVGVDPETQNIQHFELGNLVLWDTPGLGDGKEQDVRHTENIRKKLLEKDADGNALIDLVLVILDGSSRDLGTSYELINEVILPNLGGTNAEKQQRVLVAINQCDIAMKGNYWNKEENRPEARLEAFLEEKVRSVHDRIKASTGVDIEPIYYSAGYTDGEEKQKPYNLSKLLYFIIQYTPAEKRLIYADHITKNEENIKHDDKKEDYNKKSAETLWESIQHGAAKGADIGENIGRVFGGSAGAKVGRAAGKIAGAIGGAIKGWLKW